MCNTTVILSPKTNVDGNGHQETTATFCLFFLKTQKASNESIKEPTKIRIYLRCKVFCKMKNCNQVVCKCHSFVVFRGSLGGGAKFGMGVCRVDPEWSFGGLRRQKFRPVSGGFELSCCYF